MQRRKRDERGAHSNTPGRFTPRLCAGRVILHGTRGISPPPRFRISSSWNNDPGVIIREPVIIDSTCTGCPGVFVCFISPTVCLTGFLINKDIEALIGSGSIAIGKPGLRGIATRNRSFSRQLHSREISRVLAAHKSIQGFVSESRRCRIGNF